MSMKRIGRTLAATGLAVALAALLGEALWLRACALGAMPEVNGDEAFYGLVAGRAVLGRKVPLLTHSGNVPDPFYALMLAPLIAVFGPKFWVLRLPALISGVLAVVVAWTLGRRVFGRPVALALAVLMAVLPPCVLVGGIGFEHTQSPLFGLLAISYAFQARPLRVLLAFLACFLVHPTNIFLLPALAGVFVASAWKRCESVEARRRLLLGVAGLTLLAVGTVGVYAGWRGVLAAGREGGALGRDLDWGRYLDGFTRLLTGVTYLVDKPSADFILQRKLGFWALVALVLVAVPRWMFDRSWDRLGLVLGLLVGMAGLHFLAGPSVFGVDTMRYGFVFLAPTAVAIALGLEPLLRRRTVEGAPRLRLLGTLLLIALAFVPLADMRDHMLIYHARLGGGSLLEPWTVRGPLECAFEQIADDLDSGSESGSLERRSSKRVVVAQNWWFHKPLEYLALARPELRVVAYDRLGDTEEARRRRLRQLIEQGAFTVGYIDQELDRSVLSATDVDRTHRWEIDHGGQPVVSVTRLDPASGPAIAAGSGTERK